MPDALSPRDHAERVALFRAELIGALARREFDHGELAAALRALAAEPYRPPGSATTRHFGASTLERWFYAYREGGLAALRPSPRSDRGRARDLTPEQRELLLDIRREHPTASVPLIIVHTGEDPNWRTRPSILDQLRGWRAAPAAKKKLSSKMHA